MSSPLCIQCDLERTLDGVLHQRVAWVVEKDIPTSNRANIKIDDEWDGPWTVVHAYRNLKWTEDQVQNHERAWKRHRGQTDV